MAKKKLCIERLPNIDGSCAFVLFFQERALLLLKDSGLISETQYTKMLYLLKEKPR